MRTIRGKKLLFCALDIGGRIEHYTQHIEEHYPNVMVESFVKVKLPKKQYDAEYTYHFNYHNRNRLSQWIISSFFFIYTLFKYDIIYIISGENILTRKFLNFEIWCYKLFKKKIVFHFVGGDIRNSDYLRWVNNNLTKENGNKKPSKQQPFQYKLCRIAEKYGSEILVTSPDLIEFFKKDVHYIPVFINNNKFDTYRTENKISTGKITKILHAPSNAGIKGSAFIESVLRSMALENQSIQPILTTDSKYAENIHPPYSVSKQTLVSLMEESQIVIDQIVIGWYGLQTIEALLTGNQVVVWIPDSLTKYIPEKCPINHFSQQKDLRQSILKTINLKDHWSQLDIIQWIQLHHSIESNYEINNIFKELFLEY